MRKLTLFLFAVAVAVAQPKVAPEKEAALKADIAGNIDGMKKRAQVMVDKVFSFGELGFQEFETSKYLTGILEKEGFKVERGIAGIPTAWVATWGSGKPMISLGSDLDDVPQASQKPGVAYHDPLIEGAPGHGEGHNAGVPLNILAALAVKKVMEQEHLTGTLMLWPGVAEEELGSKAFYVRAGLFKDVDVVFFTHVGANLSSPAGPDGSNGLVSVEYSFKGESAHAASAPWRGRSALDAVELMSIGYEFRREHLRLATRVHYVITNGGDQPNVVPPNASMWFYFREADYDHIMNLWRIGDNMAKGAALMTDTTFTSRLLGSAWPRHYNQPVADDMYENIKRVGMPQWSEADQTLGQGRPEGNECAHTRTGDNHFSPAASPCRTGTGHGRRRRRCGAHRRRVRRYWRRFLDGAYRQVELPSNIQAGPGHNWANAISMATPIAYKGIITAAKVEAMTMLDLLVHPELVQKAWDYFNNVQTKTVKYKSFLRPDDQPAIWLNKAIMDKYRPMMKAYYYDESKYDTYLDQLGIKYPTVREAEGK